jgi:hypothetical protein
LGGVGAAFAKSGLRDYNPGMKRNLTSRKTTAAAYRLVALFLVIALVVSHPVPARDLHYCSSVGKLMDPGRDCSSQAESCCSVERPECCRDSVVSPGNPLSGAAIASPLCSDCCREFSLAEMDPPVGTFKSDVEGIQTAPQKPAAGTGTYTVSAVCALALSRRVGSPDLPPGLPIYLLSCRFLI